MKCKIVERYYDIIYKKFINNEIVRYLFSRNLVNLWVTEKYSEKNI